MRATARRLLRRACVCVYIIDRCGAIWDRTVIEPCAAVRNAQRDKRDGGVGRPSRPRFEREFPSRVLSVLKRVRVARGLCAGAGGALCRRSREPPTTATPVGPGVDNSESPTVRRGRKHRDVSNR